MVQQKLLETPRKRVCACGIIFRERKSEGYWWLGTQEWHVCCGDSVVWSN